MLIEITLWKHTQAKCSQNAVKSSVREAITRVDQIIQPFAASGQTRFTSPSRGTFPRLLEGDREEPRVLTPSNKHQAVTLSSWWPLLSKTPSNSLRWGFAHRSSSFFAMLHSAIYVEAMIIVSYQLMPCIMWYKCGRRMAICKKTYFMAFFAFQRDSNPRPPT